MIRAASQTVHDDACEYLRGMTHREPSYQTQTSPSKVPLDREGFLSIENRPDGNMEEEFEQSERDREKLCRWVFEGKRRFFFAAKNIICENRIRDTHTPYTLHLSFQ